jgi:tetratricopeptide (TPR) repeat protein
MTTDSARDRIFISYRRDDTRGSSGRLYDWLRIAFGRDRVFRDVASIGVGKWRDRIDAALARSVVCLPVIGPRWCDEDNGPRLFKEDDVLRQELARALTEAGMTVIPTLVEGADPPKREQLPEPLQGLLDWNAFTLTESGWEDDIGRLVESIAGCGHLDVAADFNLVLASQRAAEARVRGLREEKHLRADQIQALTDTVIALTRHLAERPSAERADLANAMAELARGETGAAENTFRRVLDTRAAEARHAGHEAAEAARHLANLSLLNDVHQAIAYYRQATDLDRGNPENWRLLGNACLTSGDTVSAGAALKHALDAARAAADIWEEMAAEVGLGDIAQGLGRQEKAAGHYGAAGQIATAHVGQQPSNSGWRHGLSVTYNKLGDVLKRLADTAGATRAYREALAIRESLVKSNPEDRQLQRDLAVSHGNLGMLLAEGGDVEAALGEFRAGRDVFENLSRQEPDNPFLLRDLSVSVEKIGNCLMAKGDFDGALASYRDGLDIRQGLAQRDRNNTEWQRDLSVSHYKIADALMARGDQADALAAYEASLAINEMLVALDPENADWQRDLIVSHANIADAVADVGHAARALNIARSLRARGILDPRDAWMIDALTRRAQGKAE